MLFARSSASTRARPPHREAATTIFKNAGIQTSSTRIETSTKRMLRKQLVVEQESFTALVNQVDELKRKTEKTKRDFEEYKK
jgi:hypothetical protein